MFRGHHIAPIRSTDSVNSDITGRSGVSQLSDAEASDFIQPNPSVSEPIQSPSLAVAQHPISLPETSISPTDIPDQLDGWSVDFNNDVKPELDVKLEHVLTHGATVWRVMFSPDGKYLAVGVNNGRTYIYDVKTGVKSWSVTFILVWRSHLTFVTVFSRITPEQENEAFGVSVSPRMANT